MPTNLESSAMAIGLEKVSFHSNPKKGNAKECSNYYTIASFHMLLKSCSKSSKLDFNSMWTENFQMYKLNLEKARNQRSNCQHLLDQIKSKRIPEEHLLLLLLHWLCWSDCVDHNKLWKILKEMETPDHLSCLLRYLYAGQEAKELKWNNRLVQNWDRSVSRLYIVTLLILLICRIHQAECSAE